MNSPDHSRNTNIVDPELQQFAEEHPYYALAQFDLLRSFESNRSPAFHHQAAKTALFFTNTYWLSWQLQSQKTRSGGKHTSTRAGEPGTQEEDLVIPVVADEKKEEDSIPSHTATDADVSLNVSTNSPEQTPIHDVEPFADYKSVDSTDQQESIRIENKVEPELHETEVINQEMKDLRTDDQEMAFEPLHTVDYFASQGIKITEEVGNTDKLGKQLKSFTEWLKSMKKVHAAKGALPDEQVDRRIQSIADESNASADIVTEAMAEVLEKQGRNDKAGEMYRKLSLINPSKSAYFAAKIESLKEI